MNPASVVGRGQRPNLGNGMNKLTFRKEPRLQCRGQIKKAPRECMRARQETTPWSRGCLVSGAALRQSSEVGKAPER